MSVLHKSAAFKELHASGCFVIPNPWDIGTSRYLQGLGFKALATTSSGHAFSRGLPDAEGAMSRDDVLAHIAEIVAATPLPVNADFQSGYASNPAGVAESVRLCVQTGVAGLSIEDMNTDGSHTLFEIPLALERIKAARAAIDGTKSGVLLTARCEAFLTDHPTPLSEAIARLQVFAAAGADVVFAPGIKRKDDIVTLVKELHPTPVNVLMTANFGPTVDELAEMGVRRISTGSSLARAAWTGFINAAKLIADKGSFAGFDGSVGFQDLNGFFVEDRKRR